MSRTTGRGTKGRGFVMTSFMVTPAMLRRLKIAAVQRGQSLGALLREAATQALRRKGGAR